MRSILFALALIALSFFASAQSQRAPFAEFAPTVTQTVERPEPYRPCGDGLSTHCVCREVTWLAGGEMHTVVYQLCSVCDLKGLQAIMQTASAMGMVLVSVKNVPCQ